MLINSPNISGSLTVTGNATISGSLNVAGGINATITGSATSASYVEYSNVANKPTLVSGSEQISFNGIVDKPTLVSGSSQIVYSGLSGIPAGIVSGSSQVSFNGIVDKPTLVSGSSQVSFNGIVDKPTLVSGSSQITYSGLSGIPTGIVSGSSQISFNGIVDKPTLVSGSSQVTYSGLTGIPVGIVSSSSQIAGYNLFATTGSNQFNGSQAITGSLTVTGQVVAQTLNVQQVTSSIVFSSGSNTFGNSLSNTQQFTGSVSVTGSLAVNGTSAVTGTGTTNYVPKFTGTSTIGNSVIQEASSNIGIGVSPTNKLDVFGTGGTIAQLKDGSTFCGLVIDAHSSSTPFTRFSSSGTGKFEVGYFGNKFYFNNNIGVNDTNAALVITSAGNLGLGVTPSAWDADFKAIQIQNAAVSTYLNLIAIFSQNNYADKYITTGLLASKYQQNAGTHAWFTAPSGTAGNAITFTQAMTLNASGNLSIGNTNDTYKLDVTGVGRFEGSSAEVLRLHKTSGGGSQIVMTTTFGNSFGISPFIAGVSNGGFSITDITNNVQRLIIQDSTGNVGIGTTSPANTLHVAGVGRIDTGLYFVNGGTGGAFVWNIANESLRFGTNDTERMRITSGGNVGIGVSPDVRLDVLGTSDTSDVVRIRKSSTGSIRGALGTQSGVGYLDLYNDSSTLNIRLLADGSSYFNGGNVGIGTTSPGTTLQVDASKSNTTVSAPFNSDIIRLNNTNATTNALHGILLTRTNGASLISVGAIMSQVTTQTVGSAAADLLFYTATSDVISERMRITSGGNVGIGTTPSYRLHVVTDAVAGKQNMSNISRTTGNWVRFTNPQFSTDSSMGLILKSFPDSDGRQGAGIIASGGSNNASTDLDLFVTTSPDGSGGTSYSAIKINGFNGNVGIGTTDPSRLLHILAPTGNHAYQRIEGGSGGYGGFLELMANSVGSGTDSAGRIDFYMTSTNRIATIDAQRISAAANYGTLIFSTADNSTTPTERMRITSDGYVRLTSSSGGIQFNGDTAAANALDDYEEGTWTPVFTGCTFTGTYTATYTKIGRKVTVQLSFINQSISSVTGNAQIGGLPFTSTNVYQAGSITYADILTTAGSVYVQNNNTNLYFLQNTGTTAADWNAGTNSRSLMLTATYFV